MYILADGAAVSPNTTLILGVFSGVVAIAVAYLGYLGVRHRNSDAANNPAPATPPPLGSTDEPEWVKELRRDLNHERTLRESHDVEIDRLLRMLYLAGIDPTTGHRIQPPSAEEQAS